MMVCVRVKPITPLFRDDEEIVKRGLYVEKASSSGTGGMDVIALHGQSGKYRFHAVYEREDNEALYARLGLPLVQSVLSG